MFWDASNGCCPASGGSPTRRSATEERSFCPHGCPVAVPDRLLRRRHSSSKLGTGCKMASGSGVPKHIGGRLRCRLDPGGARLLHPSHVTLLACLTRPFTPQMLADGLLSV